MATLNELNSKLQELKENLGTYEAAKNNVIKQLKESKANIKDLNKEIRDLDKTIDSFDVVISAQKDPAQKAELERQRAAMQAELEEKTAERDRIIRLGQIKQEAEMQIEQANEEIQGVIAEFASDPRINAYLQEALEIKYDEEIEAKETEKDKTEKLAEKFSLDLQDDKVFGTLVSDLTEKYSAYKDLPTFALDDEAKKNAANVRRALRKSVTKLRNAIVSRPEYADLVLTEEDFEAIVAGPNAEGKYEIPTFQEAVAVIDKTIADLDGRKTKAIDKVKAALVPEKISEEEVAEIDKQIDEQDGIFKEAEEEEKMFNDEVANLDKQIDALKASFATVDTKAEEEALEAAKQEVKNIETEMKSKNDKIAEIDNEIGAIDGELGKLKFDKAKLDELTAKADMPNGLKDKKSKAQKEYDETLKELKDKGYIHSKVYPALETEECQKAFDQFKDADYAVRKAFLDCRTDNSDAAKAALKKAMENYTKVSSDLLKIDGMEGLTVENWHDYLVRGLQEDAKKGEIDEVYYEDTFKKRLEGLKNEYGHIDGVDEKISVIDEADEKLAELQESFLKGKKVDFDKDVADGLTGYVDAMGGLFETLKEKGEAGLASVGDLFAKLGAKIADSRVGKWFSKIKDFLSRKFGKKEISGAKLEEENELDEDLLEKLEEKEEALGEAEADVAEYLEDKLTPDEAQELYEQEEKQEKAKVLIAKRNGKLAEKAPLNSEYSELLEKQEKAQETVNEKQAALNDAKAKVSGTPEEQAELVVLKEQKTAAAEVAYEANQRKLAAQKKKSDLEKAKSELKPSRPTEVVTDAKKVAHGRGEEIKKAAMEAFSREDDR